MHRRLPSSKIQARRELHARATPRGTRMAQTPATSRLLAAAALSAATALRACARLPATPRLPAPVAARLLAARRLARWDLAAGAARFGEADRDRLLAALHLAAGT